METETAFFGVKMTVLSAQAGGWRRAEEREAEGMASAACSAVVSGLPGQSGLGKSLS